MRKLALLTIWSLVVSVTVVACHASDDDAEGLAEELSDSVRREHAITTLQKLYSTLLRENSGDRSSAPIQEFHAEVSGKLTQAFIDNRMDSQNTLSMLDLMKEMQDPQTIPALIGALDWRPEVSEEHAIRAAQALQQMRIPEDKKAEVAAALGDSIAKVRQARPIDNRLRVEMIRALGSLESNAATPVLTKVFTTQEESQPFLINVLAGAELGRIADPAAVPELVKGLLIFDPQQPMANRLNSVACEALVRVGRPSYEPVIEVLRGNNEEVKAIAERLIAAVRAINEDIAAEMSAEGLMNQEASYVLGELGFREAMDPLLAETRQSDPNRKQNAAVALVRLNHQPGDIPQVRQALQRVFRELANAPRGVQRQAQLLAGMQRLYDPEMLDFFFQVIRDDEVAPPLRLEAVIGYARLANRSELARLKSWLNSLDEDLRRDYETAVGPVVAVGEACDEDLACYRRKLGEEIRQGQPDPTEEQARRARVIEKAAFMIARLGRGNEGAIGDLINLLSDSDIQVRMSALRAIDRIATEGSAEAVAKIAQLRETEEGRNIWTRFKLEALPTQARLRARSQ